MNQVLQVGSVIDQRLASRFDPGQVHQTIHDPLHPIGNGARGFLKARGELGVFRPAISQLARDLQFTDRSPELVGDVRSHSPFAFERALEPGEEFVYEFDARPFGCHLYHCHALPLKRHMHKGMYGLFVIDPDPARHLDQEAVARSRLLGTRENAEWQELAMVMNAFDTNFDGGNEVYAVNSIAHAYMNAPIRIDKTRPVRVYLVNVTEFDPINSFHLHANFFDYFDTGTTLRPTLSTVDLITQCQAQRGILEFSFAEHEDGMYMFHAHQSEFTELGWVGHFDVRGPGA